MGKKVGEIAKIFSDITDPGEGGANYYRVIKETIFAEDAHGYIEEYLRGVEFSKLICDIAGVVKAVMDIERAKKEQPISETVNAERTAIASLVRETLEHYSWEMYDVIMSRKGR